MWAEKGKQPIKPKSQGRGILVINFLDEHNGYLHLSDEEYDREKGSHPGLWKKTRCFLKIEVEYEAIGIVKSSLKRWLTASKLLRPKQ